MYAPAKIKEEIRVLGIDDCPFDRFKDKKTKIIGVMFRGGKFMDGAVSSEIKIDGSDATAKIARMINKSRFKKQLQCILIDGIAIGSFNVIDIVKLSESTKLCVIIIMRSLPKIEKIHAILKKLGMEQKIKLLKKAGEMHKAKTTFDREIFIQFYGIDLDKARRIVKVCATNSFVTELIRVAHLIGRGLVLSKSKGKA
jgi:endonuclease V-like protein UPF0215 family